MKTIYVIYNSIQYRIVRVNNDPADYIVYCNDVAVDDDDLCNKIYMEVLERCYETNLYELVIKNIANAIKEQSAEDIVNSNAVNAFQASEVLAMAFNKSKEDIIMDIINSED